MLARHRESPHVHTQVTGFFFMPYALLVTPINSVLCSVPLALFGSSAWRLSSSREQSSRRRLNRERVCSRHLGRKVKADFLS